MSGDDETTVQLIERMRLAMQNATDEALKAYGSGQSFDQFSDNYGLPTEHREVIALDLELLGAFVLDFHKPAPALMRTQWVFRHTKEDALYVIGVKNLFNLDRTGVATLRAFVDAGDAN